MIGTWRDRLCRRERTHTHSQQLSGSGSGQQQLAGPVKICVLHCAQTTATKCRGHTMALGPQSVRTTKHASCVRCTFAVQSVSGATLLAYSPSPHSHTGVDTAHTHERRRGVHDPALPLYKPSVNWINSRQRCSASLLCSAYSTRSTGQASVSAFASAYHSCPLRIVSCRLVSLSLGFCCVVPCPLVYCRLVSCSLAPLHFLPCR